MWRQPRTRDPRKSRTRTGRLGSLVTAATVLPSADLHLLPGGSVTINIYPEHTSGSLGLGPCFVFPNTADDPGSIVTIIDAGNNQTLTPSANSSVPISASNSLKFEAVGAPTSSPTPCVIGTIVQTTATQTQYLPFRVTVHNSISKCWFGNNQVTIVQGASNYVLSVYAQFDDLSIGDITGVIGSFPPDLAGLITIDATGRITANNTPGTTNASVSVPGQPNATVAVTVVAPPAGLAPLPVHYSANATRDLLFLSEGFSSLDQGFFYQSVFTVVGRLFSAANTPFDLLIDSFNVWMLYVPSSESGVTVGPPVTPAADGSATFDAQGAQLLQAKDSAFGLITSCRLGQGRFVTLANLPASADVQNLWTSEPNDFVYRGLYVDGRRIPVPTNLGDPSSAVTAQFDAFYAQLTFQDAQGNNITYTDGQGAAHPLNQAWMSGTAAGRDRGLAILLALDQNEPGSTIYGAGVVALSVGSLVNQVLASPSSAYPMLDHTPSFANVTTDLNVLGNVLAHELGHALKLGDEYDTDSSRTSRRPT